MTESRQKKSGDAFLNSEEVFSHLRDKYGPDGDGDTNAIALFAYALIEQDRIDWIEHVTRHNGLAPTSSQREEWFAGKPESYFDEKEQQAYHWFKGFARNLLRDEIDYQKRLEVDKVVGNLSKFWPSFWVGNLVGVTSNFVFAVMVVVFVAVISTDFSFIAWAKKIFAH